MTRLEKILTALIIAWIIQDVSMPLIAAAMKAGILESADKGKDYVSGVIGMYSTLTTVSGFLSKAIFGYWLYIASQKENEKKWIWCLLGVFGGIYGVLIFYPYLILKEIRSKKEPNQSQTMTTAVTCRAAHAPRQLRSCLI